MKQIVSISLGSSKRNKEAEFEILGQKFLIKRIGTDGDENKLARMFIDLDGKVDAFGLGGTDLYIVAGEKRYSFRDVKKWIRGAVKTPVLDGSGLKHTLERSAIEWCSQEGGINFKEEKVLLMSALDRYGMAQALDKVCLDVIYGDFLFGLGINKPLRSYREVERWGKLLLPVITQLPFKWFYPTGVKQEVRTPKFSNVFAERTFICGDSLFILRYAPDRLDGKTILTQSVREKDIEWMRQAGLKKLVTTTPVIGGETFATNVMEATMVAFLGKPAAEVTESDYRDLIARMGWKPNVIVM